MGILDIFTKNPSLLALAGVGIALFVFRDKISGFFSDISGGVKGAQAFGETVGILNENLQGNLTGIQDIISGKVFENFEFPTIEFPTIEFPTFEFPDILGNIQEQINNLINPDSGPITQPLPILDPVVVDETISNVARPIGAIDDRTVAEFGTTIRVPIVDEFGLGGGTFLGGVTTFGDNLVDTLSEVLNLFPSLTASQARDALEENQGLTASQFRLANTDIINISSNEDQTLLNSSGDFTGLTPTQIAQLLTGGNINNF